MKKLLLIQLFCLSIANIADALIIQNLTEKPYWFRIRGYVPFEVNPEIAALETELAQLNPYDHEAFPLIMRLKNLKESLYKDRSAVRYIFGTNVDEGLTKIEPQTMFQLADKPGELYYLIEFFEDSVTLIWAHLFTGLNFCLKINESQGEMHGLPAELLTPDFSIAGEATCEITTLPQKDLLVRDMVKIKQRASQEKPKQAKKVRP